MLHTPVSASLRASAVIHKTGQTVMGGEINCKGADFLTLFLDYTKGDETGLDVYPYFLHTPGGDEHQLVEWTSAAGVNTAVAQKIELTASAKRYITLDVRGIPFVKFYEGGSNNDGTPTGTLEANYVLK